VGNPRPLLLLASLMLVLASPAAHAQEAEIDLGEQGSFLFALGAASARLDGDTLVLEGVPLVTYFSDRPARTAGHMSLEEFSGA
jgi:hypothetical protein